MIHFDEPTLTGKVAFEAAFRQVMVEYRICRSDSEGPFVKPITLAFAQNGMFEVRQNAIGTFTRKIDRVEGLAPVQEGFRWALSKIPWAIFDQTLAFFRAVMARCDGAEAYLQVFWDREELVYFPHVPRQSVASGGVSFIRNVELEKQHVLVLEVHSHNSMGAFWSGTDNGDEKAERIYMVIGKVQDRAPEVKLRAGLAGFYMPLELEQVFETPSGPEVPQSWLDQVETPRAKTVALAEIKKIVGDWSGQDRPSRVRERYARQESLVFERGELVKPSSQHTCEPARRVSNLGRRHRG
jgi:PRTRC genetic system protein A